MMNRTFLNKPLLSTLVISMVFGAGVCHSQSKNEASIEDLGFMDKRHLSSQKESIEEVIKRNFGGRLRGDSSDLQSLQRLIDRGLVERNNRLQLQAMGAVMGDVFVNVHGMEWKTYEDERGRSRAVCVKDSEHCLFPITMLSRRMQTGLLPRVSQVYAKAIDLIEQHLPKNSFDQKPKFPKASES